MPAEGTIRAHFSVFYTVSASLHLANTPDLPPEPEFIGTLSKSTEQLLWFHNIL